MVGQIIGNAAIEVTKGIVNGQSSANEIIENAISGGANGLIGGKGASYGNANSITKSGKQMLKRIFKYKDPVKKAYAHYKKTAHCKGGKFVLSELSKSFAKTTAFSLFKGSTR